MYFSGIINIKKIIKKIKKEKTRWGRQGPDPYKRWKKMDWPNETAEPNQAVQHRCYV